MHSPFILNYWISCVDCWGNQTFIVYVTRSSQLRQLTTDTPPQQCNLRKSTQQKSVQQKSAAYSHASGGVADASAARVPTVGSASFVWTCECLAGQGRAGSRACSAAVSRSRLTNRGCSTRRPRRRRACAASTRTLTGIPVGGSHLIALRFLRSWNTN